MTQYAFDARAWIAVRVEADSEEAARDKLQEMFDGETATLGDGVYFEIGVENAHSNDTACVFEIDGEPVT